jgi:hypothetical protein
MSYSDGGFGDHRDGGSCPRRPAGRRPEFVGPPTSIEKVSLPGRTGENGRSMDPYEILGVPRGCTREEARVAFRARVLRDHPDRGGEDQAFIRLRNAYDRVVADLDRADAPRPLHFPLDIPQSATGDPHAAARIVSNFVREARERHHPRGLFASSIVRSGVVAVLLGVASLGVVAVMRDRGPDLPSTVSRMDAPATDAASSRGGVEVSRPRGVFEAPRPRGVFEDWDGSFLVPADSVVYLAPAGGSGSAVSEFGIGSSISSHQPVFTGLPLRPQPPLEVAIGRFPAGARLYFYLKTKFFGVGWAFSDRVREPGARDAFRDLDITRSGLFTTLVTKSLPRTRLFARDAVVN